MSHNTPYNPAPWGRRGGAFNNQMATGYTKPSAVKNTQTIKASAPEFVPASKSAWNSGANTSPTLNATAPIFNPSSKSATSSALKSNHNTSPSLRATAPVFNPSSDSATSTALRSDPNTSPSLRPTASAFSPSPQSAASPVLKSDAKIAGPMNPSTESAFIPDIETEVKTAAPAITSDVAADQTAALKQFNDTTEEYDVKVFNTQEGHDVEPAKGPLSFNKLVVLTEMISAMGHPTKTLKDSMWNPVNIAKNGHPSTLPRKERKAGPEINVVDNIVAALRNVDDKADLFDENDQVIQSVKNMAKDTVRPLEVSHVNPHGDTEIAKQGPGAQHSNANVACKTDPSIPQPPVALNANEAQKENTSNAPIKNSSPPVVLPRFDRNAYGGKGLIAAIEAGKKRMIAINASRQKSSEAVARHASPPISQPPVAPNANAGQKLGLADVPTNYSLPISRVPRPPFDRNAYGGKAAIETSKKRMIAINASRQKSSEVVTRTEAPQTSQPSVVSNANAGQKLGLADVPTNTTLSSSPVTRPPFDRNAYGGKAAIEASKKRMIAINASKLKSSELVTRNSSPPTQPPVVPNANAGQKQGPATVPNNTTLSSSPVTRPPFDRNAYGGKAAIEASKKRMIAINASKLKSSELVTRNSSPPTQPPVVPNANAGQKQGPATVPNNTTLSSSPVTRPTFDPDAYGNRERKQKLASNSNQKGNAHNRSLPISQPGLPNANECKKLAFSAVPNKTSSFPPVTIAASKRDAYDAGIQTIASFKKQNAPTGQMNRNTRALGNNKSARNFLPSKPVAKPPRPVYDGLLGNPLWHIKVKSPEEEAEEQAKLVAEYNERVAKASASYVTPKALKPKHLGNDKYRWVYVYDSNGDYIDPETQAPVIDADKKDAELLEVPVPLENISNRVDGQNSTEEATIPKLDAPLLFHSPVENIIEPVAPLPIQCPVENITEGVEGQNLGGEATIPEPKAMEADSANSNIHSSDDFPSPEIVRNTEAADAVDELLDWSGAKWVPPPCDWDERPSTNTSFVPAYIKEWRERIHSLSAQVDILHNDFLSGRRTLNQNGELMEVIEVPDTKPDLEFCQDKQERIRQTSAIAIEKYCKRLEQQDKSRYQVEYSHVLQEKIIGSQEPEPNPFAPTIEIYLRPVMEKDAAEITAIYNGYINTSIPEDQAEVTESDILHVIEQAKASDRPFIVAVKGQEPIKLETQSDGVPKYIIPQFETIIGFAWAESYTCGLGGARNGRSRASASLQFYVRNDHTRKGVGRNLLDRLIHTMSPAALFQNGAPWINPSNEPLYNSHLVQWHQLFVQMPTDGQQDDRYVRVKNFLSRFYFKQVACLYHAVRSSTKPGPAKFLDLAIFQVDASHHNDFEPHV